MSADEPTEETPAPTRPVHLMLGDLLMIPTLTSLVTAAFTLGGIWVTFGNVKAQAHDNGEAIAKVAESVEALAENLRDHEHAEGHPVAMDRWSTTDKRLTRIENEDRRQGYNIVAICTVTGAACDLAVTP